MVCIGILPSAVLTLVILGLQSAQFSEEVVSEVVHPPSKRIRLDSGSLFESVSDPTYANSHSPLIARDSFSETMISSTPSRSIDILPGISDTRE